MTSSNLATQATYDSDRVRQIFGLLAIDKSRLPSSGLNAIGLPSFVAEWLLDKIVPGRGPLSRDELAKVSNFTTKALPRKDDANVILFDLTQGEVRKLIALMQVRVKLKSNGERIPEPKAKIPVLNFDDCAIPTDLIQRNKQLLRQGLWGKISLSMLPKGELEILDFDPFQCSAINLEDYASCRAHFNFETWRDLLLCSMGFNPEHPAYSSAAKRWMLARLLPLVEANYHVVELAPKGTGKSFIFENISSRVAVISGGKATPAQLFINGRTKEVGLLGRHDVVVLDEVQSLTFDNPDEVIGPLKTYLANGRYNRAGFADISSDCSLVMLANIDLDSNLQPRSSNNLFANLPDFLSETAFIDRLAGVIPGWKIPKFQRDMIAHQVGLKMDFFGEVLLTLRRDNRFYVYAQSHTKFNHTANIRDQNAILKSATGFLKLLYPHFELTLADYERECLKPAVEMRQEIRKSLLKLDEEFKSLGEEILVDVC